MNKRLGLYGTVVRRDHNEVNRVIVTRLITVNALNGAAAIGSNVLERSLGSAEKSLSQLYDLLIGLGEALLKITANHCKGVLESLFNTCLGEGNGCTGNKICNLGLGYADIGVAVIAEGLKIVGNDTVTVLSDHHVDDLSVSSDSNGQADNSLVSLSLKDNDGALAVLLGVDLLYSLGSILGKLVGLGVELTVGHYLLERLKNVLCVTVGNNGSGKHIHATHKKSRNETNDNKHCDGLDVVFIEFL